MEAAGADDFAIKEKDGVGSSSDQIVPERSSNGGRKPCSRWKDRRWKGPANRSSKGNWTREEDGILIAVVKRYEGKRWKKIAECLHGRTAVQCLHRWQKVLNPELIKGPWTPEEDDLLTKLVMEQGIKKWAQIAKQLPGRVGKQCRERWTNHLSPGVKKGPWTGEEERILIKKHSEYGNKWSEIAKCLPGRTENSVKNHWNCSLKKRLHKNRANGTPPNHAKFARLNLHGDNTETGREDMKTAQNTSSEPEETENHGDNGESCCLHLALGCSCISSSHSKQVHSHCCEPGSSSVQPPEASNHLPHYLSSPTDLEMSSPTRQKQHSDIHDSFGMSDQSYVGLCYVPLQWIDDNILHLSARRFPQADGYIHQLNRPASTPASASLTLPPPDFYAIPEPLSRNAGTSYVNTPSILTKRKIHTWVDNGALTSGHNTDCAFVRQESRGDDDQAKPDKDEVIKSVVKNLEKEFLDA